MQSKNYKISFCIVCMNRLHQLRDTLLQNINDNKNYSELEFIVLDYNSQDDMEDWIKENMSEYILNGKMIYYKTFEPNSFSHSHSKNLAFKLSNGDIVCNINADHYTGPEFANYINQEFNSDNNIVLTTIDFHKTKIDYYPSKDVFGRVCVRKSDFLKINGFDERMNRYGFEDWDFINRLELVNVKRVLIEDFSYLKFISHGEEERYLLNVDNLHEVYVSYSTPSVSELIFLYKDQQFEKGTLIDNSTIGAEDYIYAYQPRDNRFEYTVKEPGWETGTWKEATIGESIHFLSEWGNSFVFLKSCHAQNSILQNIENDQMFYKITNQEIINDVLNFNYFIYNRSMMEENLKHKRLVNINHFGKATVFKNFKSDTPILI